MVYLLKMVIFHGYVKYPEGIIFFWGLLPKYSSRVYFSKARRLSSVESPERLGRCSVTNKFPQCGPESKKWNTFFLNHMCLPLFIYQSGLTLSHLILLWHLILSHLLFSYLIWSHLVTFVFWLFSSSYRILCYISMLRYRYTYHSIIVLWDILHPPF